MIPIPLGTAHALCSEIKGGKRIPTVKNNIKIEKNTTSSMRSLWL